MTQAERMRYVEDLKDIKIRQCHADALNRIFRGSIGTITESQITPEIAKASDFLEGELFKSEILLNILLFGIQATLTGIFIARLAKLAIDLNRAKGSLYALAKDNNLTETIQAGLNQHYNTIFLSAYDNNKIVKSAVNAVNVRWKNYMGLLLYGVIDELPY